MTKKERLDVAMVNLGLVESRNQAQRVIMAGQVKVNGVVIIKASDKVNEEDLINLDSGPQFVSRGGEKLQGALDAFNINDFSGKICADVGASTGGFTDCMLQHGAKKVYAIDVGYGILHWKMRNDERVVTMERTNARYIERLDDEIDFISIDVSFISLDVILPVVKNWLNKETGEIIALVKPQFEAGKEESAKGKGVIRDPAVHKSVLSNTIATAISQGLRIKGLVQSPILGPKGNKEFLLYCSIVSGEQPDTGKLIRQALSATKSKDQE